MLQIDHVYKFLYQELFKDFYFYCCPTGTISVENNIDISNIHIFTPGPVTNKKIFFYDQEPLILEFFKSYFDIFNFPYGYSIDEIIELNETDQLPYNIPKLPKEYLDFFIEKNYDMVYKKRAVVVSEKSDIISSLDKNIFVLYYFFHGFAALDWYRGFYALNYNKSVVKPYTYDYVSFNRIVNNDRSYRIYWVSRLAELKLLNKGQVSFNVTDSNSADWRDEVSDPYTKLSESALKHANQYLTNIDKLVIDSPTLPGSASADIPKTIDALWHVVTETVFYYDKLHLTEKIFKPIVSKQPFMLLAAPGNLEYLRSYGFKTFDGIIDESYDTIQDNDQRIEAVAEQLRWYCNLSAEEKSQVIERLAPIVEYNFHHFYGAFKHIITKELLNNCKILFKEIGYDDSNIAYDDIYKVLTN